MRDFLVSAADLLLGVRCPGCDSPALGLCRSCGEDVRPRPRVTWPDPVPDALSRPTPVLPVSAGVNDSVLRTVLLAWKEHGRHDLTPVLGHLLAASVLPHAPSGEPIAIVPVPTSRRSRRERGADLVDELARSAVRLLAGVDVDARVERPLAYARRTADQAGLGHEERAANLAGAFTTRSVAGLVGRRTVVVDDILTTGSTVAEAVRSLSSAGCRPVGVAVVAATRRTR